MGVYNAQKDVQESMEMVIKLWGHECMRVFHDRLITAHDQERLKSLINEQLELHFQMNYVEHCMSGEEDDKRDAVFVDFLFD